MGVGDASSPSTQLALRALTATPLLELVKFVRMVRLAARHRATKRAIVLAIACWLIRKAVRSLLRHRAADKLVLDLCERTELLQQMRRIQSVQARLETIHETPTPSATRLADGSIMRRAQSLGNLVRHGMSSVGCAPPPRLAINLDELRNFSRLHKSKLCGECLSRCTSALSLASMEEDTLMEGDTAIGERSHPIPDSASSQPLDNSPVGSRGVVAADRTVHRVASITAMSATGSSGGGSTGSLVLSTGQPDSSVGLDTMHFSSAASSPALSPPLLSTLLEDSAEYLHSVPQEMRVSECEVDCEDEESSTATPHQSSGLQSQCTETNKTAACPRRHRSLGSEDFDFCDEEYSAVNVEKMLARVAARLDAEVANSGKFLDARGAYSSLLNPVSQESYDGCVACTQAENTWRTATRRAICAAALIATAYSMWLRFVARRDVALVHIMAMVHQVAKLFHYRVKGLEHIPKSGAAMIYCYHGFIPLDMYFFQEAVWRMTGRLPRVLVADFVFRIPFFSWLVRMGGGVPASRGAALEQLKRGELVVVAPGGVREGMSSTAADYSVKWYGRQGFAETACAAGAPLIPMCTRNVRELFLVLGGNHPLILKLYKLTKLPFTPFLGPLLVPLTTLLGEPLPYDSKRPVVEVISMAKHAMETLLQRATAASKLD